jgi:DNA (cytosine-5)-methyltransferase 1
MLGRYAISDTLKIGSLCTGYGGLDMAVEAYFNAKTVWVSEIDKYACKVIDARINKPNIGNLKIVNWAEVEPVDIITAGYPCQPFSHAGLRKGVLDERHLWPYIKQAISTIRPSIVILENVRGHFKLGFREVLTDLTSIGYDVRWSIVRASDVGAPHRRERLFIVAEPADTDSEGLQRGSGARYGLEQSGGTITNTDSATHDKSRRTDRGLSTKAGQLINGSDRHEYRGGNKVITNADGYEQQGNGRVSELGSRFNTRAQMRLQRAPNPLDINNKLNAKFVEYMMGLPAGWVTDLDISRSQQLKILGNGVVPQQAYRALELLCNINSYPQGLKTCGQHAQARSSYPQYD